MVDPFRAQPRQPRVQAPTPPLQRLRDLGISDEKISQLSAQWSKLEPTEYNELMAKLDQSSDAQLKGRFDRAPRGRKKRAGSPK